MFSSAARRTVARIALAAMLFSVGTPTFAASLFAHRADIGARILGITAPPAPSHGAAPQEHGAHHGTAAHAVYSSHDEHRALADGEGSGSEHAAHGTYCSFCLTASSIAALLSGHAAPGAVSVHATAPEAVAEGFVRSLLPLVLRARGPPSPSRS